MEKESLDRLTAILETLAFDKYGLKTKEWEKMKARLHDKLSEGQSLSDSLHDLYFETVNAQACAYVVFNDMKDKAKAISKDLSRVSGNAKRLAKAMNDFSEVMESDAILSGLIGDVRLNARYDNNLNEWLDDDMLFDLFVLYMME